MYSGGTFHGYAEIRVTLENRSPGSSHRVTIVYPDNSYGGYGNNINRITRTVTLAAGTRSVVSLLQPPLPISGGGSIRVEVDDRREGEIRAPNANSHCNNYSPGNMAATAFISRSLDFDAVLHVFDAGNGAFTASKAAGPPDASGTGYQPNCWMPDTRRGVQTNWLELDYPKPETVDRIVIYNTQSPSSPGFVELIGTNGTSLAKSSMTSGRSSYGGSSWTTEFLISTTGEPVKTVRLNFGKTPPSSICIDAVQISGPSGSQWASDARASSDNSASAGSYLPGRTGVSSVAGLRAEAPISEWSENWLPYTPFDAIALRAGDLSSASPATASALWSYLQAGGNIIVFGGGTLPETWRSGPQKPLRNGIEYDPGLGHCFVFTSENPSQLDATTLKTLRTALTDSARYWQNLPRDSGAANAALPVVENLKIPTRGIVLIMLLFIIAIGPVNIILLNRRKRRTWMLWTIPAISFATTLLVFAYSLLREGVTPDTRIAGLTVLDQAGHHATTVGATGFYCPLTPSGGLQFDPGTEASPLVSIGYGGGNNSGASREMDWSQSQHLSRGWVSARVPALFHLRKSETRRERLQIITGNGQVQVVNGLGVPIKSLWYADAGMNFYQAGNIPAGQKTVMILSKQSRAEKSGAEGLLRDIGFAAHTDPLGIDAGKYLLPNTYIAVLDGNPFIENALGSAASPKRTKSSTVVFGTLAAADIQ